MPILFNTKIDSFSRFVVPQRGMAVWTALSGHQKILWATWFWKIFQYFKISNKFNVPISLYPIIWTGMG
jgi:hypothetical protein